MSTMDERPLLPDIPACLVMIVEIHEQRVLTRSTRIASSNGSFSSSSGSFMRLFFANCFLSFAASAFLVGTGIAFFFVLLICLVSTGFAKAGNVVPNDLAFVVCS